MAPPFRHIDSVRSDDFRDAAQLAREGGRRKLGCYLIEGESMVEQALRTRAGLVRVMVADHMADAHPLPAALSRAGVDVAVAAQGMLFKMLGTSYETSTWCVGIVRIPAPALDDVLGRGDGLVLIAEQTQDPRNVGVLVRTADAAGAAGLVLTEDSADPYCRAAVRSTTGSILNLPVVRVRACTEAVEAARRAGYRIVGTSAGASRSLWSAALPERAAVVIGNESTGLRPETVAACDETVRIPMRGGAHSLNVTVAAGILLFEWRRQRTGRDAG